MSTNAGSRVERFQSAFFSMLEFIASRMFSKHGKRIMFISSLYTQVTQLERLKSEVVSKLNSVMGLATREEAIHFPANSTISSIVWRNTHVSDVLTREVMDETIDEPKAREISSRVVDLCPRWIRYAARSVMEQDVVDLILNGRAMAAA